MKTYASETYNAMCNGSISILQWNGQYLHGKNPANYYVIAQNPELAYMQGVRGDIHIECIVDDFGRLVRTAS